MTAPDPFDAPAPNAAAAPEAEALVLEIAGFEGPIDLLLALARDQKVDLTHVSILQLADQYLAYVARARALRLELAADWLVMAAWLAYLKSRLLLPVQNEPEPEPTAAQMAEALAFQLRRLEAMQTAAVRLMARPRLGEQVFGRGMPEGVSFLPKPEYRLSIFELLTAYADQRQRGKVPMLSIEPSRLYSVDAALARLSRLLGRMPDWQVLSRFLPLDMRSGILARSAVAATLVAGLELAKQGKVRLRQEHVFGPIFVRAEPALTELNR